MTNWFFSFCAAVLFSSTLTASPERVSSTNLENCLLDCYQVDASTAKEIVEKFSPLLENPEHDSLLRSFIEESEKLHIYSTPAPTCKPLEPYHTVLFENDHLRISWAVTESGEQEPFQNHPWKTLMVVIQPSEFYSEQDTGTSYTDNWPMGVYLLDPSPDYFSCKNIGPQEYHGLIFEVKTP